VLWRKFLPITNLGMRREALTGSGEFYKKKLIEYLEVSRGLFPKMDSFIEGTLADCILFDKNSKTEYWLEAKATTVSLTDTDFISELAKYLSAYLNKSPENRFKMIIGVQNYRNKEDFEKIYEELDEASLKKLLDSLITVAERSSKEIITNAKFTDIKKFFEDTEIIRATSQKLQDAIEKRRPKPPLIPKLSDAKYAAEVLDRYKTNEPLKEEDFLVSNLFQLKIPKEIVISETSFTTKREFCQANPEILLPRVQILSKKVYSFFEIQPHSNLGIALNVQSSKKVEINKWGDSIGNVNIILFLLHRWIEDLCYEKGLAFDERTDRYFFFDEYPRKYPKNIRWKSPHRTSVKPVITPVMRDDGTVYYYAHRAVQILIRSLWGEYFVQLIPGRIFTGDCYTPYPGDISDKLDRAYRKSNFTRNKNQLNDVLFWSKFLFSDKSTMLQSFLSLNQQKKILSISEQVGVWADRKPNAVESDTEEESEEITTSQVLDSFLETNEED
jgi:hypothetical protein